MPRAVVFLMNKPTIKDFQDMWMARAIINWKLGPKADTQMWLCLLVWARLKEYNPST